MAISFKCGGCAKQYSVKDELAGKKAQCKKCGQVMLIPQLAASHEPDVRNDGGEGGNANAETVAGSLINQPLDTVSGRSASGQSMSGRSMSGRSMSGRSMSGQHRPPPPAYEPPPEPDYAEPQLAALNHVAQSEHDAFAVEGGHEQKLRVARGPAQRNRAPMEPWSFLLLVVLLGVLGYSAFVYRNAASANVPADVLTTVGKPTLAAALSRAAAFVVTLAVITPLVMAAWYGACKIVNFRLPPNLFMRSAGLAALPVMAMAATDSVPALRGNEALVALATLPLGYLLLQFVHNQVPALAGVTVGLGAIAGAVGLAVAKPAQDNVAVALRTNYDKSVQAQKIAVAENKKVDDAKRAETAVGPVVDPALAEAAVKDVQAKVAALKSTLSAPNLTREKSIAAVEAVALTLDAAKEKFADRPEWSDLDAKIKAERDKATALPTATPPADLAEAPPAGTDWTATAGSRREVSAFAFNITPPLEGVLDLDAEAAAPMRWTVGDGRTTLSLESVRSPMTNQQRPWVAPAFVVNAAETPPVSVIAEGSPKIEYGTINGMPATKVTLDEGSSTKVVYTVHKGAEWLKATISNAVVGDTALAAAQAAVRSLRERASGEPVLAAVSAADLIGRFESEPQQAEKIASLLKGLSNAEDTVVKAMGFAPNESQIRKFGPLLIAVATERSTSALWQLAGINGPLADKARQKLIDLDPKAADEVAFALVDIKSGNSTQIKKGLSLLAQSTVDKNRQATINRALQSGIEDRSLLRSGAEQSLEEVVTKYFDDELGKKLQGVLDNKSSARDDARLSMRVLAATGKKKYVYSISKWAILDANAVIEALSGMGPTAEVEVARYLNDVEMVEARKVWLAIIERIGTQRSLSALQTCASKSGDAEVREQARALFLKIRERTKTPPSK